MDVDEFSDDGLDDLPENALLEIENQAIQFTQAQPRLTQNHPASSAGPHAQHSDYGWEEEDDLDTTEVVNDAGVPVSRHLPDQSFARPRPTPQHQQLPPRRPIPPVPNPRWNPTVGPAKAIPGQATRGHLSQLAPSKRMHPPPASGIGRQPGPSPTQPGEVLAALQRRVRVLESDLNAAQGEASILRANSLKTQREYDAQVARLKKANSEQLEKHGRMMDAALVAEKNANTELQFLQQDMKEISGKTRRKDGGAEGGSTMTTPKKTGGRNWGFADGFDEMDIVMSPSKGQGRGKFAGSVAANVGERTPSKAKRKRPAINDSPILPLEIRTDDVSMGEDKGLSSQTSQHHIAPAAPAPPYEFLQLVLDHGSFQNEPPTFDVLSRFSFPSDPDATSLASKIFERLPLMGDPQQSMQIQVDFAEFIVSLWTRCFEERFWEPIKYLMPLLSFTLQLHSTSVAPLVFRNLVPNAQSTICLLAEALQTRLPDGTFPANHEYAYYEKNIDTVEAMSLLYVCALACMTASEDPASGFEHPIRTFWKLISLDFVFILLSPKQRFGDIVNMLDLLALSSLPESLGPIPEDKEPSLVARTIIERVSAKLTESPRSLSSPYQKRAIRSAALRTLISFAKYPYGAIQLASHENALPRLVACLSTSIDELYDQPIPRRVLPEVQGVSDSGKLPESSYSTELNRIISQCVLLIHALVTDPETSNVADIGRKLSLSHGGSQRNLLSLGRLTFAEEDLILEAGIDSEVVEAAHELLELAVTPDEGEVVSGAFGS